MGEEHTPRPDDHLVEPMYEALRPGAEPGPSPEVGTGADTEPGGRGGSERAGRRGCLALLLCAGLLGSAWACI